VLFLPLALISSCISFKGPAISVVTYVLNSSSSFYMSPESTIFF
jgi:hypothetical protein